MRLPPEEAVPAYSRDEDYVYVRVRNGRRWKVTRLPIEILYTPSRARRALPEAIAAEWNKELRQCMEQVSVPLCTQKPHQYVVQRTRENTTIVRMLFTNNSRGVPPHPTGWNSQPDTQNAQLLSRAPNGNGEYPGKTGHDDAMQNLREITENML